MSRRRGRGGPRYESLTPRPRCSAGTVSPLFSARIAGGRSLAAASVTPATGRRVSATPRSAGSAPPAGSDSGSPTHTQRIRVSLNPIVVARRRAVAPAALATPLPPGTEVDLVNPLWAAAAAGPAAAQGRGGAAQTSRVALQSARRRVLPFPASQAKAASEVESARSAASGGERVAGPGDKAAALLAPASTFASPAAGALVAQIRLSQALAARMAADRAGDVDSAGESDGSESSSGRHKVVPASSGSKVRECRWGREGFVVARRGARPVDWCSRCGLARAPFSC